MSPCNAAAVSSPGGRGGQGAAVSLYAASSTEGTEDKVRVSRGTVAVSSVVSTEVSSRLVVSLESTGSVVRASFGLALEGGTVSVSGAAGMVVSTGPAAEGGMVLMTDVKSEGTVDLRGSGVRVASESARVQVVVAGGELQEGCVGVSSSATNVIAAGGVGRDVQRMAHKRRTPRRRCRL